MALSAESANGPPKYIGPEGAFQGCQHSRMRVPSAAWRQMERAASRRPSLRIVVAGLQHDEIFAEHLIDEPVLLGDAARPCPRDPVLERLRPANPARRVTQRVVKEPVDALDQRAIGPLPG